MLKENWRLISRFEKCGDFLIIIGSFFLAYYTRDALVFWNDILGLKIGFGGDELAPMKDYFIVLGVAIVGYFIALHVLGAYSSMRLSSTWQLLRTACWSSLFVFVSLAATLFLLKLDLSRSFIVLFCGYVGLLLGLERYAVLRALRFWRRRGRNFRNVVICGIGEQAIHLAREILRRPELGVRIRGFCDLSVNDGDIIPRSDIARSREVYAQFRDDLRRQGFMQSGRIIQGLAGFGRAMEEYAIDEAIFTDIIEVMPKVEEAVIIASEQGVRTTIVADLFSMGMATSAMSNFGGMPLIHFQTPPGDRWELGVKRVLDVVISLLLLTILSPLMAAIAGAIRVSSGSPILFRQTRVGLNGRLFTLFKFRSMRPDAEHELAQLKERNEMRGPVFKLANDPRITPIGKILRRYSLDELPQLINVLRGDMSLVGPRPPVPGEVSLYERSNRRRLSMRPGITCTWQVSGRNEIKDFESWVRLDLEYIDNWSLGLDFILLLKTVPAVIFGTGAR